MGAAAPIIAAVVGAASAGYGVYSQRKAAKKQDKLAEQNARNLEMERAREGEKLADEQKRRMGAAQALAASSGAKGGSLDLYMDEMGRKHQEDLNWLGKSTRSQAGIIREEGQLASQASQAKAWQTGAGGLKSLYNTGARENWWS